MMNLLKSTYQKMNKYEEAAYAAAEKTLERAQHHNVLWKSLVRLDQAPCHHPFPFPCPSSTDVSIEETLEVNFNNSPFTKHLRLQLFLV